MVIVDVWHVPIVPVPRPDRPHPDRVGAGLTAGDDGTRRVARAGGPVTAMAWAPRDARAAGDQDRRRPLVTRTAIVKGEPQNSSCHLTAAVVVYEHQFEGLTSLPSRTGPWSMAAANGPSSLPTILAIRDKRPPTSRRGRHDGSHGMGATFGTAQPWPYRLSWFSMCPSPFPLPFSGGVGGRRKARPASSASLSSTSTSTSTSPSARITR